MSIPTKIPNGTDIEIVEEAPRVLRIGREDLCPTVIRPEGRRKIIQGPQRMREIAILKEETAVMIIVAEDRVPMPLLRRMEMRKTIVLLPPTGT
jgi:hypothetical protein